MTNIKEKQSWLCPHRVSSLLSWGQRAFPRQRGKLRTGLEARSTIGVSLEISQRVKTQNAYHVQKYFNRCFIFSGFTSDKCSLRHPPVRLKRSCKTQILQKSKSLRHYFLFLSSLSEHTFTSLKEAQAQSADPPMAGHRVCVGISDCTLPSSIRLPASLESLPWS